MLTKKPQNRFLPQDWHRSLHDLRKSSSEVRDTSFSLRQETQHLRNELENKTNWDAADNTTRLQDRVYETTRLRDDLNNSLNEVKCEIERLQRTKEVAEREVEAHLPPIEVTLECLALRERRRDGDLVKDDVEVQLEEELKLLEKSRSTLEKLVLDTVSSLRVLQNSRQRLEADLAHKISAMRIDTNQSEITEFSPHVSFKPDPTKSLSESVIPSAWFEFSTVNTRDAEASVRESQLLRDAVCVAIQTSRREREVQARTADFALRRRLHQEVRARDELQWEKGNLLSEIGEQEREILKLEQALNHSMLPLKVSQARLENRKWREGKDLVEDAPHEGLRKEVFHLRTTRDHLRSNLDFAKNALQSLQAKLRLVDADLVRKNLSVILETKTQGVRTKLDLESSSTSLTEINLTQTGSIKPHPISILK